MTGSHHSPRTECAQHGNHKLHQIRHHQSDALTGLQALGQQPTRKILAKLFELCKTHLPAHRIKAGSSRMTLTALIERSEERRVGKEGSTSGGREEKNARRRTEDI